MDLGPPADLVLLSAPRQCSWPYLNSSTCSLLLSTKISGSVLPLWDLVHSFLQRVFKTLKSTLKQDAQVKGLSETVFHPPVPILLRAETLPRRRPACQERYLKWPPVSLTHLTSVPPSLLRRCPSVLACQSQITLCLAQLRRRALIPSTLQLSPRSLLSLTNNIPLKHQTNRIIRVFTVTKVETARYIAKKMALCLKKALSSTAAGQYLTCEGQSQATRNHMTTMRRWWEMEAWMAVGVLKVTRRRCKIPLLPLVPLTTQRRVHWSPWRCTCTGWKAWCWPCWWILPSWVTLLLWRKWWGTKATRLITGFSPMFVTFPYWNSLSTKPDLTPFDEWNKKKLHDTADVMHHNVCLYNPPAVTRQNLNLSAWVH